MATELWGAALYLARKHSDKTLRELGGLAGGTQYPAVTMAICRLAKRLETDKALARKAKRVEKMLFVFVDEASIAREMKDTFRRLLLQVLEATTKEDIDTLYEAIEKGEIK